jgi:hypothetical protein
MRRIKKVLKAFFDSKPLTDKEKQFIKGCLAAQIKHPQLTARQWEIICSIEEKHKVNVL